MQGLIMDYRECEIPVARACMEGHEKDTEDRFSGVLKGVEYGCGSEELRKEAQRILFGLKQ